VNEHVVAGFGLDEAVALVASNLLTVRTVMLLVLPLSPRRYRSTPAPGGASGRDKLDVLPARLVPSHKAELG